MKNNGKFKALFIGMLVLPLSFSAISSNYLYRANATVSLDVENSSDWLSLPDEVSEWVAVSQEYNCSEWLPYEEEYLVGQDVSQSRSCSIDYNRTITKSDKNTETGEVRTSTITESKVENESFTQNVIGLNNVIDIGVLNSYQEINTNGVACENIPEEKRNWIIKSDISMYKESLIVTCGNIALKMQADGQAVLYHSGNPAWVSGVVNWDAGRLSFQSDGNLVVYMANSLSAIWSSGTYMYHGASLVLTNGGNLQIVDTSNNIVWSR